MDKHWCTACGQAFVPRPQSPRQLYCSKEECQQSRKRLWQITKRKTDPDYHQNQARAQASWRRANGDYWRQYRDTHPDYAAQNRARQRLRNAKRGRPIANSDTSTGEMPVSGIFKLTAIAPDSWAGRREWIVQLDLVL
ncbi:hypothetical protein [Pseudorhodoferax sp. Leaf267]|uniref:hypothetical protein n=1 Tax=Pseudorhodoferax sp. Leaf267 TaxID=1736316 RepID=UPI0009EC3658|nr:hypothetical protein [Pseudorhodoferax sp. Leaf267]